MPRVRSYQLLVLALFTGLLMLSGCSDTNTTGVFDPDSGHPSGWIATHPPFALPDAGDCTSCHGANLGGGVSGVSCLNSACHHDSTPNWISLHPASALPDAASCTICHGTDLDGGLSQVSCLLSACHHDTISNWVSVNINNPANEHGASAKRAPGSSGFISCKVCHGNNFSGGISGTSCFACHFAGAPHPTASLLVTGSLWRDDNLPTHTTTDNDNAPVCGECHAGGLNSPDPPPPPPSPGDPLDCFNNTLCHGLP